ncbi:Hsp20/alpha crystallin family protein [Chloroflexi bacterium CFX2]|nr:Hsp20/alpha crystallin family protein [Chloroflexi bacterium CFX2]
MGASLSKKKGDRTMTLYIQPYPFAQGRPFRRTAVQHWALQPQRRALGVNVREEEDAFLLTALVPGLKAEDLNIQVLGDEVSIEGEYKAEEADYLLNELPQGAFRRTLRMPAEIDPEHVEAKIADGVLTLTLPKAESARPRKIKVNVR